MLVVTWNIQWGRGVDGRVITNTALSMEEDADATLPPFRRPAARP